MTLPPRWCSPPVLMLVDLRDRPRCIWAWCEKPPGKG